MPVGPGDEILDAIEAGKADKDIIAKYKLNSDQLRNFKALHYGLSNQEMNYNEIGDYFPDLNSYFKGPSPVSPPTPQKEVKPSNEKPIIEKPDFTRPVHEKALTESTAMPGVKQIKQSVETAHNVESLQQKFDRGAKESLEHINKTLASHDDVLNKMIQQGRYRQAKEQAFDQYANMPKSDMPAAARLAEARNILNPQETKPWEQPVTPEETANLKQQVQTDESQARNFINQVAIEKPEEAKDLEHSMYLLDATQRMKTNPDIGIKVNNNLKEIKEGKVRYDPLKQQLIRPEGLLPSIVSGIREHARQMDNYDLYQGKDEDVINLLEKRRAAYDPDKPVPVPSGTLSEIGQMTGMEWKPLLKGMAVGAVTEPFGGEAAAPYISAAVNAPEYYKRGYSTALEESYNEFRQQGKSPQESLQLARDQAKTEGKLGAAEGFVSSFIGGRIGLKELPKFNVTGGFKNAVNGFLKSAGHGLAETSLEGITDGLVAGYLQDRKDAAAEAKGLFRNSEQNVKDNIKGEITFAFAMAGMTKLGKGLISPETYNKIKYWVTKQNPEAVQSSLGQMVINGQVSKEDADNITKEIGEQKAIDDKVPNDIKDVSRQAMIDKIKQRQELEKQLENTDEALHPEIKEKIKKLNEEIAEHSQHKKTENESETKAETQADAEAQANGTGIEPGPENTSQPEAGNSNQVEEGTAPVADNKSRIGQIEQAASKGEVLEDSEPGELNKLKKGEPESATDKELQYTNPEGTSYVLRGGDLYHVGKDGKETKFSEKAMQAPATQELINKIKEANNQQNAIPEQSPEGIHVPSSSGDSQEVGARNESQGSVNEESTSKEKIEINNEEDLEREISKVYSNKAPRMDEMAPKEINNKTSENSFQEYHNKAKAVLNNLLPGLKIRVYDNSDEYYQKEGRPKGSLGSYDPTTHSIAFNMPLIEQHGKQSNVFHEILHPIVNKVIGENQEHLDSVFGELESLKGIPELSDIWAHHDLYYNRGPKIQKVEAITQFLTYVADGRIDTSKMEEKTITKIIDVINKILSALGIDKQISTASDLKRLSDSITKAFQEQNTKPLEETLGNRISNFSDTGKLDQLTGSDQENALRAIIKKTPASISNEKLKEIIVRASGISEQDAQDLIDEMRKPVIPPKPVVPTSLLNKEERKVSINKIENALNQPKPKEQSWLSKQLEGWINASAWLDNPYRFITKIVEDINKHYGLTNKEAIPLGRQFEKTASGRAALKIDSFINDIIRGNINGEKLGKLTGEKYKDFQKYLFSRRVIDRLNQQENKARAGEDVNRQTGNVTRQDAEVMLDELKKKYGNLDDFKKRGEAFQKHMDTMLQTLVASGILSQESYDQIKADNDFYAPFSVVQAKLLAGQDKQPVGISGVIKRIKGIDYKLPTTQGEALTMINSLSDALNQKIISPEEYFNTSFQILNDAKSEGLIDEEEYNKHLASLENPGFAINDILDAGANMIYKAEGMALKNNMLQRLYAYKGSDKEGLFIQDVDGFKAMTLPDGSVRMVPKPLDQIKVDPGMAPIKLRVGGQDKIVAVNKRAAEKLTQMSNYETSTFLKIADGINKIFRAAVITLSPGFQAVNFMIDFTRTAMLSRYGPLAGKGLVQPVVNAALFMPQYIEALMHSAMGNLGYKTDTYKQWMNSDSFSKGMFDNLFDNEKRIKEVAAPLAKRVLSNFFKLHWIDVPGSILEQTHKIATHQRGMSVEGFKPEMVTAMMASIVNKNINPNMSAQELKDGMDRLNYEVQNFAGSPNFPQTHKYMKLASMFLQFFSARVKGEMTDYRRVANLFSTITPGVKSGKGEGVKLSKQDALHMGAQFLGAAGMIAAYAIRNNMNDDDEKEFNGIPPYHQDNYLNIPLGYFDYTDEDGNTQSLRDYAKIPLRGLTATMNVMANSFVKFYKRQNPGEFKKMAEAFAGNASPINLQGKDERELGESLASNLTPVFKYFIEYSFNRDTHNHRNIVPDFVQGRGMLSKYRKGEIDPWDVATKNTPDWAKNLSKFLFDNLGIRISAIELDHMENTMGNPTELYNKAVKKRLLRSESKYPLYKSREEEQSTSSATISSTPQ